VLVVGGNDRIQPTELHVKLVDFGLASSPARACRREPEFRARTPAHLAEQLRGLARPIARISNGLGAVLFELLTGAPPYHHDDLRTLCLMHLTAPIPTVESPARPAAAQVATSSPRACRRRRRAGSRHARAAGCAR